MLYPCRFLRNLFGSVERTLDNAALRPIQLSEFLKNAFIERHYAKISVTLFQLLDAKFTIFAYCKINVQDDSLESLGF